MLPDGLSLAILPGLPKPETGGARYDALLAYVRTHGPPHPALMDHAGVVWAGRTLVNVCCDLGITVSVAEVADGEAAALQELATRDLSVLESADLVTAVYDGRSTKFVLPAAGKRSQVVSEWFRAVLGKDHGFSPSQVEQYVRVGRCDGALREVLAAAKTLHQAIRIIRQPSRSDTGAAEDPRSPSTAEEQALESMAVFMEDMGQVKQWSPGGLEILKSLHAEIGRVVRANRKQPSTLKGISCTTN